MNVQSSSRFENVWFGRGFAIVCALALSILVNVPSVRADVEVFRIDNPKQYVGVVTDDEPVVGVFTITNVSNKPAKILLSFCHFCHEPALGKNVLAPGEQTTLVLQFETKGKHGSVGASTQISAEGISRSSTPAEITADVHPRVWTNPQQSFPRVVQGHESSVQFEVIGREKDFRVTKVELPTEIVGDQVSASIGETFPGTDLDTPCVKQMVTLKFLNGLPLGTLTFSAKLLTNDKTNAFGRADVQLSVVSPVSTMPASVVTRVPVYGEFSTEFDLVCEDWLAMRVIEGEVITAGATRGVALDIRPLPGLKRWRVRVSGIAEFQGQGRVQMMLGFKVGAYGSSDQANIQVPVMLLGDMSAYQQLR